MNLNNIIIGGRLTRDPELKHSQSGVAICRLSICNNQRRREAEVATFLDCTAFGKTAETIAEHMTKGQRIVITGKIRQENWEKDGEKRSKLVVDVDRFDFVDPRGGGNGDTNEERPAAPRKAAPARAAQASKASDNFDDIPF
jgi:single-strand DNA-binding protein